MYYSARRPLAEFVPCRLCWAESCHEHGVLLRLSRSMKERAGHDLSDELTFSCRSAESVLCPLVGLQASMNMALQPLCRSNKVFFSCDRALERFSLKRMESYNNVCEHSLNR